MILSAVKIKKARKDLNCNKCHKNIEKGSKCKVLEAFGKSDEVRCLECDFKIWERATNENMRKHLKLQEEMENDYDANAQGIMAIADVVEGLYKNMLAREKFVKQHMESDEYELSCVGEMKALYKEIKDSALIYVNAFINGEINDDAKEATEFMGKLKKKLESYIF